MQTIIYFYFMLYLAFGSVIDFKYKVIPNIISIAIFITGLCRICFDGNYMLISAIVGAALPLLLFIVVEMIDKGNVIGGGDYKLFISSGFMLGCPDIILMMFASFFTAFIYSMIKKKQALPLCPFAFIGAAAAILC